MPITCIPMGCHTKSNGSSRYSTTLLPEGQMMNTFIRTVETIRILFLMALLFPSVAISRAQQNYVGRYNIYTGFSDLSSPGLNSLNQIGFHLQAAVSPSRLIGTGFDYSVQS